MSKNKMKNDKLPKGVSYIARFNRYRAYTTVNQKFKYLGSFKTAEEAIKCREDNDKVNVRPTVKQRLEKSIKNQERLIKALKLLQKKYSIPGKIIEAVLGNLE